jgi:hypothetical protein
MNFSDKQLTPNPGVVFTIVDNEAILLEQETGRYYGLNEVGTRVWLLLGELGRVDKVYEELLAEFEVDEVQLKNDLEKIVAQFVENGLMTLGYEGFFND